MDRCRSCNAPVFWAKSTKTHKPMPLDRAPTTGGRFILTKDGAYALALLKDEDPAGRPTYQSHFSTCPQAGDWRNQDGGTGHDPEH